MANSFEDSAADIVMIGSAVTDDNTRAYDAIIQGIFRNLAEQVLTATIKNKKDFRGFY